MREYNGTIYRPPVEANTFLLPITEGCSHNACRFCSMYKDIPFRMLPVSDVEEYLAGGVEMYHQMGEKLKRIYLVGADPFALSCDNLIERIKLVKKYVPECETITMYAAVRNIMTKSDDDLKRLKEAGVNDLYVGIESGLNQVLSTLNKGNTAADAKKQSLRLLSAGIDHMDMLMLGAAGKGCGKENAIASAGLLNETKPKMILINSMSIFPETNLYADVQSGTFVPAGEKEMLEEERMFIDKLELPDTFFWAAHALDAVRFQGYLGKDKAAMLGMLDEAIDKMDEERFTKAFGRETRSI
jgi:radical SAM superfamily enzyme YgiQ (UPF0313 family)